MAGSSGSPVRPTASTRPSGVVSSFDDPRLLANRVHEFALDDMVGLVLVVIDVWRTLEAGWDVEFDVGDGTVGVITGEADRIRKAGPVGVALTGGCDSCVC
jgi:hypothetical protein